MIPFERSHLIVNATTHAGMSGKDNEDRYAVSAFLLSEQNPIPSVFTVVTDGIGGHRAGEVAAELAVENISQRIAESDASQPVETLEKAIVDASRAIMESSQLISQHHGMGCTCACAWVIGQQLFVAYVGDSRIYLVRNRQMIRLSRDHTWVQEAMDGGFLQPEQARNHPNAHVIRRYLGSAQPVVPDTRLYQSDDPGGFHAEVCQGMLLLPDDILLLCTDGLTDLVNDEEILEILTTRELADAIETMVQLANQRGGHDNITLVTLKATAEVGSKFSVTKPLLGWRSGVGIAISLMFVVLSLLFAGGYWWINNQQDITPTVSLSSPNVAPASTEALPVILIISPTWIQSTPSGITPTMTLPGLLPEVTLTPWPTYTTIP